MSIAFNSIKLLGVEMMHEKLCGWKSDRIEGIAATFRLKI